MICNKIKLPLYPKAPKIILILLLFVAPLVAQDKTQYLLHEIPQTIYLNPAVSYECQNYIELPLISQLQYYYRNSGFSYNRAVNHTIVDGEDSLHINMEELAKMAGNYNNIRVGGRINFAGFGFRYYDWYFSLNISNRTAGRISFSRDIPDARDGNWDLVTNSPRDVPIYGTSLNFINYTEYAFGAGFEPSPGLSAGVRIKYLMGAAHVQTRRSEISLYTSDSPVVLSGTTNISVRGSLPVRVETGSDGYVEDIESEITSLRDIPALLISPNHGFAIDAGISYEYSDNLNLSASILDFGIIRWKRDVSEISQEEDFIFGGIDLNDFINSGSETDFLQALEDTVSEIFTPVSSPAPYTAFIPVRMLAGAAYSFNDGISFGAVTEAEILSGRLFPSLTLTAVYRPAEFITASASYSLMDRGFSNLGFSFIMGNGPLQFYFVTDNLPLTYVHEKDLGVFWPYRARTMNFRTGINVLFGCSDRETRYRKKKWRKSCPAYN